MNWLECKRLIKSDLNRLNKRKFGGGMDIYLLMLLSRLHFGLE